MENAVAYILYGIFYVCVFIMHYVALINATAKMVLDNWGVSPLHQLYIFFAFVVLVVVLALRVLGGMLGWVVTLLALLLVVERIVPGLSSPAAQVLHPIMSQF